MSNCYWLWYPGDFELYHAMKQNFSRVERGYGWPAFWKSEGFRNRVAFRRVYHLEHPTTFHVHSDSIGFVMADEKKYPFGAEVTVPAGVVKISVHAACIEKFPSIYVEGSVIRSDPGWMVEDYANPPLPAGYSRYFTKPEQDPAHWDYSEQLYLPAQVEACQSGYLYTFETELDAVLWIKTSDVPLQDVTVYFGESRPEALDTKHCYYNWKPDPMTGKCPRCAFRYVYIPGRQVSLAAIYQYVEIPVRSSFRCGDEQLDRIWAVAAHTFRLCSGIFFIDGVKRDKWIWAGDAYQSLFVNRYLTADADIERRTLLALRGNDPMQTHINTIVDYSLLWLLGVAEHYYTYRDRPFLRLMYPKMASLLDFCRQSCDEQGFLCGRVQDWVFVDWADLDKDGPLAAIQMLLAACWQAMADLAPEAGQDPTPYRTRYHQLVQQIQDCFWDPEQGAYIDSWTSGRRHVSRQSNIFALLFGIARSEQRQQILKNVIHNPAVPPITTPYFNFFALDMLARQGELDTVMAELRRYWGGMLDRGAVTFWEEFDPTVPEAEQYDMYGDKFGKSLCHAWSASPIYLLARYFIGLRLTSRQDIAFELEPKLQYFSRLDCTLPVGDGTGSVRLLWDGEILEVQTAGLHGELILNGTRLMLSPGMAKRVKVTAREMQ